MYPRILLLTSSVFNQFTGGGVMLTNLFKGWPSDRIATAHGDYFTPDESTCQNYFKLTKNEIGWIWPFSLFQKDNKAVVNGDQKSVVNSRSWLKTLGKAVLGPEIKCKANISDEFQRWLDAFKPELIYTLVGGPYMKLAMRISNERNIPIVSHMMDDWPAHQTTYVGDMKKLFDASTLRMVICDEMGEEYKRRYGHNFSSFQNSTDVAGRWLVAKKDWKARSPFKIVYVGSIVPNAQLNSLIEVVAIVKKLRDEGVDIEMHIHSPWSEAYTNLLHTPPAVYAQPPLEEKDIFRTLTDADLLLLPVNFDKTSVQYIRFSMPAKIPLYMISGTPILVYGPADVASVRYATREKWGYLVTERGEPALRAAIAKIMQDQDLRESLGKHAQLVARENHDADKVRRAFQTALVQCIS